MERRRGMACRYRVAVVALFVLLPVHVLTAPTEFIDESNTVTENGATTTDAGFTTLSESDDVTSALLLANIGEKGAGPVGADQVTTTVMDEGTGVTESVSDIPTTVAAVLMEGEASAPEAAKHANLTKVKPVNDEGEQSATTPASVTIADLAVTEFAPVVSEVTTAGPSAAELFDVSAPTATTTSQEPQSAVASVSDKTIVIQVEPSVEIELIPQSDDEDGSTGTETTESAEDQPVAIAVNPLPEPPPEEDLKSATEAPDDRGVVQVQPLATMPPEIELVDEATVRVDPLVMPFAVDPVTEPTGEPATTAHLSADVPEDSTVAASLETEPAQSLQEDIVTEEPVKILDPSVDVEATTYLAEANQQTESDLILTTESFRLAEPDEVTTVTEADDSTTTESATEQADPLRSKELQHQTAKRNYRGYKVYRVVLPSEDAVKRILAMEDEPGIEFWADPRLLLRPRGLFVTSAADMMVAPQIADQVEKTFRQSRLIYSVLIEDVHMAIANENPATAAAQTFARSQVTPSGSHRLTWERYHRLSDINSFVDYLRDVHPDWIQVVNIGKSSQGRPIQVVKFSRPSAGLAPKEKKSILIDAGVHANEWITVSILTWMMNEMADNGDAYRCILDRFDWYFIPVVNPDGYEYSHAVDRMWRKTRRNLTSSATARSVARKLRVDADADEECVGVDLNANFEFNWKSSSSIIKKDGNVNSNRASNNLCSPSFAGLKPFSEPESRALANFMLKQRPRLAMYISLHSYSQMWLLPWGFSQTRPQDFSQLYSLAKVGARALQKVHNTSYLIGSVPDLLAIASGTSQDWAKGVAGVNYSYTVEVRDAGESGMILPARQIIPTAEETWAGIYASAVELAHRFYPFFPSCSFN